MNRILFLVLTLAFATHSGAATASFPEDFQEAMRLVGTPGKMAEAEAIFLELAGRPSRKPQGSDAALEQASLCAVRRNDFEEAGKRADQIREEPLQTLCRMRILDAQRRWKDVVSAAGGQDLATWAERLIYDAAMCRGRAYAMLGDLAAEKDFLLARTFTIEASQLALANLALGNFYRDQAKDDDQALAAYKTVADSSVVGAAKYDSVIACAQLLAKQGKEKEAIGLLDSLETKTMTVDWRCRIHQAYGDVYVALKRPDDAQAAYRHALAVPDISAYMVKVIEARLGELVPQTAVSPTKK